MAVHHTRECRGMLVSLVDTTDVRVGDKIACWLSDATATPTVTGWSDRELNLRWPGHANPTHRTFIVVDAPWWVDAGQVTANVTDAIHIVARESA